ncbi:hypothetical protein BV25DRAFT_1106144 [Artomyces pyxidatus]|uniref:Uncharacterized protein n=1 Tax=Artomyces pyxidatus TaxID=48021 RepID=A0ACB8TG85_9AGAM|nr:hypothetical protein BV25DRAFT_1106144 [Artomyces pyxidatus]
MDSAHLARQLRFVVPGGLVTYYLHTPAAIARVWDSAEPWARLFVAASGASGLLTVSLFLYILSIPLIKGIPPNYRSWRESGELSSVIPVLTTAMILGWSVLSYVLGQYSSMGYLSGIIGSSGLYALAFGIMGLIPAPRVKRQ